MLSEQTARRLVDELFAHHTYQTEGLLRYDYSAIRQSLARELLAVQKQTVEACIERLQMHGEPQAVAAIRSLIKE